MKQKVWLVRDIGGDYSIGLKNPVFRHRLRYWSIDARENKSSWLIVGLCRVLTEKWFELQKPLPKGKQGIQEGYFEVKFTPIKRRKLK